MGNYSGRFDKDFTVIVTGGGNGIGREYVRRFIEEGARVAVLDRDVAAAEEYTTELQKEWKNIEFFPCDVSKEETVRETLTHVIDRFGKVDALINNASIFQRPSLQRSLITEMDVAEWRKVIEVNLTGTFICIRTVAPLMITKGYGKIVNISSGTIFRGAAGMAHYVSSKAAIVGLTRTAAVELGKYNITVNAVAPGFTLSQEEPNNQLIEGLNQRANTRAMPRIEFPSDIAGAVLFFCSHDSDFITGQTLVVDGGTAMH